MSAVMPPSQDDDDWQATESGGGQWEDFEGPRARRGPSTRTTRTRRPLPFQSLAGYWSTPGGRILLIVSAFALLFACVLGCVALVLTGIGLGGRGLLFPTPTPTIVPSPTAPIELQLQDAVKANGAPLSPGIPSRLDVGGKSFVVRAVGVDAQGAWIYDVNDRRAAWWSVGSLVNYVIGLHNNTDNAALFESLKTGDLLTLETAAGLHRFRVTEKMKVSDANMSALADQSRPRVTLVMFGQGGSERDALVADYTDEGTPGEAVAFGAPVNLGDVRVHAFDYAILPGRDVGLNEGRNLIQVNLQVTNLMTEMLDSAQFTAELIDGQGKSYPLSQVGTTARGGAGWQKGVVAVGTTMTLTSAFEVPSGMAGPMLEWNFHTTPDSPYIARVMIPYESEAPAAPTPNATPSPRLRLDVANANVSPDGTEVSIIGNITDLTGRAQTVSLQDISLVGADGGRAALNSSLPPLSWEINAGATLTFKLSFAMPVQLPATLTVLDQRIVVGGN